VTPAQDRWVRAIGYGLLAEIATIFTIIAIVLIYRYGIARGLTDAQYVTFAQQVGTIVGVIGGTVYVYLFARLLMRRLISRFVAHGIVVAIAAIALSVGGSLAGHQGVPPAYLLASVLKLIAGGLAGSIASRRAHLTS
jgi:type IV secretory pathway VirB2 component (pilin)